MFWAGDLLATFGWTQIRGENYGLADLAFPNRPLNQTPDAPTQSNDPLSGQVVTAKGLTKKECEKQGGFKWIGGKCMSVP